MWQVRLRMRATRPRARGAPALQRRALVGVRGCRRRARRRSRPWFASAFATAERSTFSMSRATARCVKASTVRASGTLRPRMCSSTSRALRGGRRAPTSPARARPASLSPSPLTRFFTCALRSPAWPRNVRVGANSPSLCPTICSEMNTGHVLAPVVDRDRVPDHLGEDGRRARPGADHPLGARRVHLLDPLISRSSTNGPFFELRLTGYVLSAATAADDQLVGFLVLAARALAERRHAPRRHRVTAALRLALAATVRMVDRVHRRAAHRRPLALPPAAARLAARHVLVVDVPDLPDGGSTG